jgi:hypothetical protein
MHYFKSQWKASLWRQICLLRAVFASRYHDDVAIDYDCLGPLSSGWEQTPPLEPRHHHHHLVFDILF